MVEAPLFKGDAMALAIEDVVRRFEDLRLRAAELRRYL
jgi:hypothetical protein